ncbi:peroxiredoxin-like family protein [Marinivivus vitaminiproducens]|uniref:peroxiredoxin-like family protein n=1 Tax=Marinivivus vitaminiproducens TaxID=3035935 RepID=UPI0027A5D935|nr:peroxiredoxin-like family protein [Geminicoccaceae bacterium SCSIO 64248]
MHFRTIELKHNAVASSGRRAAPERTAVMDLEHELAAFKAAFARTAPAGRPALYEAKIEELRASFARENAIGPSDRAPDFDLPSASGSRVALSTLLRSGPVVLTFYRGGWCPYCNIQLRAYQMALPEITAQGARLVAVSPQLPDASLSTAEKNALTFDVLSDVGNEAARAYGLVYALPEELRDALRSNDKALPAINGDESWELPVPATYVIARDGRVTLAFLDVDYRKRLEPEAILAGLRSAGA